MIANEELTRRRPNEFHSTNRDLGWGTARRARAGSPKSLPPAEFAPTNDLALRSAALLFLPTTITSLSNSPFSLSTSLLFPTSSTHHQNGSQDPYPRSASLFSPSIAAGTLS